MPSIIPLITTPLGLSALIILVGAGILRLIVVRRPTAVGKVVVQYGFWLAITMSLLANIAYMYSEKLSREALVSGVIVAQNGDYLPKAIVDIPGKARAISDDNGSFSMSIPQSRVAKEYNIDVSLAGYENRRMTVRSSFASTRIELSPKKLVATELLAIGQDIIVGHYLGLPEVQLNLGFHNLTNRRIKVSDITLRITEGDSKNEKTIFVRATYLWPRGQLMPPLPEVSLAPNQRWSYGHAFVDGNYETAEAEKKILTSLNLKRLHPVHFRLDVVSMPNALVSEMRQLTERNWFWNPGKYELLFSCTVEGEKYQVRRAFELDVRHVSGMKRVLDYFSFGFGTVYGFHNIAVGDAKPVHYLQTHDASW